jgi:hypothetical protein
MKKNNKILAFLIVLLLIIWGNIGMKISKSLNNREIQNRTSKQPREKIKTDIPILMNYRDPFLDNTETPRQEINFIHNDTIVTTPPKFSYKGRILLKSQVRYILENNNEIFYAKRDTVIEGYRVLKSKGDTLIVIKNNLKFFLAL